MENIVKFPWRRYIHEENKFLYIYKGKKKQIIHKIIIDIAEYIPSSKMTSVLSVLRFDIQF